ncbi:MAG: hypothetical protein A2Z20_02150 [Bdellovibrionales bacterium RBG_16_40_8]|nr:MAG: hypothetical protein A2Z20_02150 [Bdellovibrionales bacterium RBG_16_40_8]
MSIRSLIFIVFFTSQGYAAIDHIIAKDSKKNQYIEYGTISGGESGGSHTLLGLRRVFAPKDKIERILLDLGDSRGKPLHNKVSYFQVSIDKKQRKVVVDLSQMLASGVSEAVLKNRFKSSPLVKDTKISYDPQDNTITMQLFLKKNVQVEAFTLPAKNKPSCIVIDLKEKT